MKKMFYLFSKSQFHSKTLIEIRAHSMNKLADPDSKNQNIFLYGQPLMDHLFLTI